MRIIILAAALLVIPEIVLAKRLELDNGVYVGGVRSGQPSGTGTMKFKNGNVFEGTFKRKTLWLYPVG